MATYDSDLRLQVVNPADNATGWSELAAPHSSGSPPAVDTENFYHNSASISQATGQASGQGAGFQYLAGAPLTWTASSNWCIFFWTYYTAPTNLTTWATGGLRVGVGDADNDARMFNAMGVDFDLLPLACWQSTAIDPEATEDQTVGTVNNATSYQNFAILPNVNAKISKGSPTAADIIRYGRGQLLSTGADCTFAGMATFNDNNTTGRYGLFTKLGSNYRWKGLMQFGDASNSATMTQSNINISVEDTPRVLAGFNKVEIYNTGTSITWTNVNLTGVETSITGSAPVSPGDFEVVDSATVSLTNCNFTDLGTFIFNGVTNNNSITNTTFRRTGQITGTSASFTGCVFDNVDTSPNLIASSSTLSDNTFIGDGTSTPGHAVDLGTRSGGTSGSPIEYIWDSTLINTGNQSVWEGTTQTPTTGTQGTANSAITVDVPSGSFFKIAVQGSGTIPTVQNTGTGSLEITANEVTLTLTNIVAESAANIAGGAESSEVRIFTAGTQTELSGIEDVIETTGGSKIGTFGYTYTFAASTFVDIVVFHRNYQYVRINNYELGSSSASLPINQIFDRNYNNP